MIDSGTDSIASLALCAGLWLSVRKSRRFPLGLYKIENVISVVVALFIFLAGYEIATKVFSPARAAVPPADNTGRISAHFGESPYFALLRFRLMDHHLIKQEIVENPHQQVEKAKGIRVAEWLVNQQVDELLVKEEMRHKGPG